MGVRYDEFYKPEYLGDKLRWDESKVLDIPFGERFLKAQGTTEYKEPRAFLVDDRLKTLVDVILEEAIDDGASDIMIEPTEDRGIVSFRIDGKIVYVREIHRGAMKGLVTVIQDRSNMGVGRYKEPNIRGHITHRYKGSRYDFRVSGIPSIHGYAVDMRLLTNKGVPTDITKLGMPDDIIKVYRDVLKYKEGMVVFTGGTGSGKSTSIVAGLNEALKTFNYTKKLVTVENPVEFVIEGALQTSLDESAGYTFPKALQTFLRFNPDLIMVGEINDEATAKTVSRAAGTGHLVFTTVHANNVLEVVDSLVHYGVDEKQVFQTLRLVIYQTLQPKLCPHCSKLRPLTPMEHYWLGRTLLTTEELLGVQEANLNGCEHCDLGYKGLVLMGEMLLSNAVYRELKNTNKLEKRTLDELKRELMSTEGAVYYPLEKDVLRRLKDGSIGIDTAERLIGK